MGEVRGLVEQGRVDADSPLFLSYAHLSPESDRLAERFYNELRDNLQTLIALPLSTDIGFFDKVKIRPAVHWDQELADALGTCQVLVALVSVPYLKREWCGKEWHAFKMRDPVPKPDANRSPNLGPIIPVRWTPVPSFKLPAEVGKVQFFTPTNTADQHELSDVYNEEGVFRLLRAGNEGAFGEIVWQLAKCIQDIYYCQQLLSKEFAPSDLRNIFEDDAP
jgi:hypothetical protein